MDKSNKEMGYARPPCYSDNKIKLQTLILFITIQKETFKSKTLLRKRVQYFFFNETQKNAEIKLSKILKYPFKTV